MSVGLCLALAAGWAAAPTLPPGFVAQEIAASGSWDTITGLAIAPDGRLFVIEKRGRVHVVQSNYKLPLPFIDLEREVLNNGDRGLLGIALDPRFEENGYMYLLYTVDPNEDGIEDDGVAFGRLTRYQASSTDPNEADLASRQVLIGETWTAGIPSLYNTHTIGSVRFGADGSLLVSTGDGAHAEVSDPGGRDPLGFGAGRLDPTEDIGAFRSQWTGSLSGKILRVDPTTGGGLPSNPYFTGNPSDNASRVWAYGLRNPFRIAVRPGTGSADPAGPHPGAIYIGDVGWRTWEEVDVCPAAGANFGWPCSEGPAVQGEYSLLSPTHHGCGTLGTPDNPSAESPPLLYWHHDVPSLSSIAGLAGKASASVAFYTGTRYPEPYRGACFFADYEHGWIKAARVDSSHALVEVLDFASNAEGPVEVLADPSSGDLLYVSILRGKIWRIRYDPSNGPPAARASADPVSGEAPLEVQFSSAGTSDPDIDPLTYLWHFGDGTISTEPGPMHVYGAAGHYAATLTVEDGRGGQSSASVAIDVAGTQGANQPPVPVILEPLDVSRYLPRASLVLKGAATDAEDPAERIELSWEVVLHHNTHIHPAWLTLSGPTASFLPGDHDDGTGTWLEIILRAKDSQGLTASRKVSVFPEEQPIVMDNGGPGTSSKGTWSLSGGSKPYGTDSVYSKTTGNVYAYSFNLPAPGTYKVYAWWTTYSSRTEAAPYTIIHSRGSETVIANQKLHGDQWNHLGTYIFGSTAMITVTAVAGGLSTCADAVLFLPAPGINIPPVARIDSISPGQAFAGEPVSFAGHGEDDGSITAYEWTSSLDGLLSRDPTFTTTAVSIGTHAIALRVADDKAFWSEEARAVLFVGEPPQAGEVILDDGQPGTSFTGSWRSSGGPSPYGPASLYSRDAGNIYRFEARLPEAGTYDIYAWWTQYASRTPAAAYTIASAAGNLTVTVDQRTNGGKWNLLGSYALGATGRVTLTSAGGGFTTSVDAVRWVLPGEDGGPPPPLVRDNGDAGTSSTGTWLTSGGVNPYGSNSLYAKGSTATYTYTFGVAEAGTYEVLAWWTSVESRSTQASYTIVNDGGSATVKVNQRLGGGQWNSIGTFQLTGSAVVRIDAAPDGKSYCADSVSLRRLGN